VLVHPSSCPKQERFTLQYLTEAAQKGGTPRLQRRTCKMRPVRDYWPSHSVSVLHIPLSDATRVRQKSDENSTPKNYKSDTVVTSPPRRFLFSITSFMADNLEQQGRATCSSALAFTFSSPAEVGRSCRTRRILRSNNRMDERKVIRCARACVCLLLNEAKRLGQQDRPISVLQVRRASMGAHSGRKGEAQEFQGLALGG